MVRIGILGPIELWVGETRVDVTRAQIRRLLAAFALRPGSAVSPEVLIEHVWGDNLPTDPRASLRVALTRLRSALGSEAEALQQSPSGYTLIAETDALRFGELRTDGSTASLVLALDLWRGPAFGEFGDDKALGEFVAQLSRERWSTIETLAELLLVEANHDQVIELVRPAVQEQPHRERLAMVLAMAYASQGRKAEALGVLREVRDTLRSEFGVEPARATRELEHAILRGHVDLLTAVPRAAAATDFALVGRAAELEKIAAHKSGLLTVVGESGSGKSRLLAAAAQAMQQAGRCVVSVTITATPEMPMEGALRLLEGLANDAKSRHDPRVDAVLAQLDPSRNGSEAPREVMTREHMLSMLTRVLCDFAASSNAVLMIDDLQWLDRASAEVIEQMIEDGDVCLIAGCRPEIPRHVLALWESIGDPSALGEEQSFTLDSLPQEAVHALVSQVVPSMATDDVAASVFRRSGGNALFVTLLLQVLQEGLDADDLPINILVAVQRRIETLSASARETLQIASVFPDQFSLQVLEQLRPSVRADLDEAAAAGLITVHDDKHLPAEMQRGRFFHQLVAEGVYQMLAPGRQVVLHDEVGRLMEQAGSGPTEWAVHAGRAAALDPLRAIDGHWRAASEFQAGFGWDMALRHALEAREHLDVFGIDDAELWAQVLLSAGRSERAMGNPNSEETLMRAVSHGSSAERPDLVARALIELCSSPRPGAGTSADDMVREAVQEMLRADLAPDLAAELRAVGATVLGTELDDSVRDLYLDGLARAVAHNEPSLETRILSRIGWALPHPGDHGLRVRAASHLARFASADPTALVTSRQLDLMNSLIAGNLDGAKTAIEILRDIAPSYQAWNLGPAMHRSESAYALFVGDDERAEHHAYALLEGERRTVPVESRELTFTGLIAPIREVQGRVGELLPLVERLQQAQPEFPTWRMLGAAAFLGAGDEESARRDLDHGIASNFGGLVQDSSWWGGTSVVVSAIEFFEDEVAALLMLNHLKPQSGLRVWNGVSIHLPGDELIKRLATVAKQDPANWIRERQIEVSDGPGEKEFLTLVNRARVSDVSSQRGESGR